MSTNLSRDVNRTVLGNVAAKSIFIFLGDEANAEGYGWPGLRYIASCTEVSLRTVMRVMQVFEEIGLIEKVDRGRKNGKKVQYGTQIALEKLGSDLSEEFRRAFVRVQGASSGTSRRSQLTIHEADASDLGVGSLDFAQCLRDGDPGVSETQKSVSETQKSVSETFPPDPLIGVPVTDPLLPQPPDPRSAGENGCNASLPWGLEKKRGIKLALDQVMQGCSFTARRLSVTLREVIEQEWDKGEHTATTALTMITAWSRYQRARPHLATGWSARAFFAEGHWRKPESWPYSREALREERMQAEARVGSR
jgi:hypothetical protein